jgi:hypothetical protein
MSVRVEKRDGKIVFVDGCNKPIGELTESGIELISKHGSKKCRNPISLELIEEAKRLTKA